jgi:hypothetical protein
MEEANIFLLSSLLDLALPLTTTADAAGYNNNGSPPSLILNLSLSFPFPHCLESGVPAKSSRIPES